MTLQQFMKGLFMSLMAIIVTYFSQSPVEWGTMTVVLIGTALVYTGKNAFTSLQSDSPSGVLNWKNFVSAGIIAIGTGLVTYVGQIVAGGVIDWLVLAKVAGSVTFTYLGSTLFTPEVSKQRKLI